MATFAVIAPAADERLSAAMRREFPEHHLEFSPGQFVLKEVNETSEQIARRIGAEGQVGNFVVFTVAGFWGYHRQNLWEWLTVRMAF